MNGDLEDFNRFSAFEDWKENVQRYTDEYEQNVTKLQELEQSPEPNAEQLEALQVSIMQYENHVSDLGLNQTSEEVAAEEHQGALDYQNEDLAPDRMGDNFTSFSEEWELFGEENKQALLSEDAYELDENGQAIDNENDLTL
jgi:hypothetical protein